ncbi:hypothetical protein GCM10009642_37670 [Nocardiopsis metallicus]
MTLVCQHLCGSLSLNLAHIQGPHEVVHNPHNWLDGTLPQPMQQVDVVIQFSQSEPIDFFLYPYLQTRFIVEGDIRGD